MNPGLIVLLVVVLLVLALGGWRLRTDGRFKAAPTHRANPTTPAEQPVPEQAAPADKPQSVSLLADTQWRDDLGERATLLQFSSAFCAPCRATRRTLGEVAEIVPGVRHIEVDAELHLALVRELGIMRTPTTLVLDASGQEVTRAAGAPSKDQVLQALGRA
ncbi:MAG TPA: thioredoxin family protein [Nocardioides sp.]